MDLRRFIDKRPELYHLTAGENLSVIRKYGRLYSTNKIIDLSEDVNLQALKRQRRPNHYIITIGEDRFSIRDQQPLSERLLEGCLTDDWVSGDWYSFLNDRVFTWPTLDRLYRHFNRYADENPVILVLNTQEIIGLNPKPLFAKYNTGATRASSHWGGKAPERGANTFQYAENCNYNIGSIAEVTFFHEMILPNSFQICNEPEGIRETINLEF